MAGEQGIKMVDSYKELLLDGFPRFGEVLGNKLGYNCGNMENLSSQLLKFTNMFPKCTFIFYHFYSDFELGEKFKIKGNELKHRKVIIQIDYRADQNLTINLRMNMYRVSLEK